MLQEELILTDDPSWVLVVELGFVDTHDLELLDGVGTHCVEVDARIKWSFLGDDLELTDSQVEYMGHLDDNLPYLLFGVDYDIMCDFLGVKRDLNLDVLALIVLLYVLNLNVHVIKALYVGANQSYPIQTHINVHAIFILLQRVKLYRDSFNMLQEAFSKDFAMLSVNLAL